MEWTKYTTKEALKDNDELMILDKDANANKRTLMDKVWDYVVDKMTTAVIAKLGTTNKTLIGAVNELNSKRLCIQQIHSNGVYKSCDELPVGETAIAFNTALNKPSGTGLFFIFCMGSNPDKVRYQLAVRFAPQLETNVRLFDYNKGSWSSWN